MQTLALKVFWTEITVPSTSGTRSKKESKEEHKSENTKSIFSEAEKASGQFSFLRPSKNEKLNAKAESLNYKYFRFLKVINKIAN